MGRFGWIRRHRVLAAFAAGVFLTLAGLAVAGYLVLSDQRRTARVLAAALSRALAREVRIDRVTDVGTQRLVMRGVELPREGGWPARVVVDRVEATGPLLAAARGDAAPVRLTVSNPTVEVAAGGGALDFSGVEALRQTLRDFLAGPVTLDVALTAGLARHGGGTTEFDLVLRKVSGEAKAELTLREPRTTPLVLVMTGHAEGQAARLGLTGRGGLALLAGWLPARSAAVLRDRALELTLDLDLAGGRAVTARGRLAVGDVVAAEGTATVKDGALEATLSSATGDLAFAAAIAGLDWTPTGRVELSQVTARWLPGGGGVTVRAAVRVAALTLPAAGVGTEVAAERLDGRLALEPAAAGAAALSGDARAVRLRVAGVEAAPVETRYRLALAAGRVTRLSLDGLAARLEGADLRGAVGYDPGAGRLEARLEGQDVEAGGLIRRLAPGWLDATERVRLAGLALITPGLDPRTWQSGAVRLEGRGLRWQRSSGIVSGARLYARAELQRTGLTLSLEAERVASTLAVLPGEVPRLTGSAELTRRSDGGLGPQRAALTARDGQGRDLVVASLQPAATAGRLRLAARAPALERLDGLWPTVPRRLNGSARLDVELAGTDLGGVDGRLALEVPEGELRDGKISIRDLAADLPIRRGSGFSGEPSWGRLQIGELIAYGVVVRDLDTPGRVFHDRLSLNALSYGLYSGEGKGWTEIESDAGGLAARGQLTGAGVRVEEFIASYGIRGGTMTGLMRYAVDYQYRAGRLGLKGRFEVPDGGAVNIELLNRLLAYADADSTGVVRRALENLREFDYKSALIEVHTAGTEILASLALQGRERFLIFPPRVRAINIKDMPLSFLARQFPGAAN